MELPPELSEFILDISAFEIVDKIKSGAFATVFRAREKASGQIYAAKDINAKGKKLAEHEMIKRELSIFAKISHPTILPFRGVSLTNFESEPYPTIFTELMTNGSLGDILRNEKLGKAPPEWTVTKKMINIYGICRGLEYLHKNSIIHRDVKPDNVLLDENLYPRITDFGMSNIVTSTGKEQNMSGGTPVFIAPEIYTNSPFDYKVDVYAFGMMLYQIICLKEPFAEFRKNLFMIWHRILSGARPPLDDALFSPQFKSLICDCWARDPAVRPTFTTIIEMIENGGLMLDGVDMEEFNAYRTRLQ